MADAHMRESTATEGPETVEEMRAALAALEAEHKALTLAYKRQGRQLALQSKLIERNSEQATARANVSRVVREQRSQLEQYMNLLLDNCPDMILLLDQEGGVIYATQSFLARCGIPGMGIIRGGAWDTLLAPYLSERVMVRLREILGPGSTEEHTVTFGGSADFSGDGDRRSYTLQVSPMLAGDGQRQGFMMIFSDTTDIVRARQEAERANAAKSDFLATVSHEIRTPMNAIIGVAGMLKNTGLNERQHEFLRSIQDSSHVLLNLINDILDFSKIEAGKLELVMGWFRLEDLLRHLRAMFELMFQQKGLAFVCCFDDDLPHVVCGDDKRIRQVLTNILNNALKYTRQGSVTFRACREGAGLAFIIEDTGIGIREEALPRLFTAFEQLDLTRNKGVVGTGLGLAITRRLTELMGGRVGVKSTYGAGSTFTVHLELQEGEGSDLPPDTRGECPAFRAPTARVLIVDDIEINLEVAAYMLEPFGVSTDFAKSGVQAVDMATRHRYDLILMDHMMPEMDGIEATRCIRAMGDETAQTPIVALSANAVSGAVEQFYRGGMNDFLSKPMDETALARCLYRWLPAGKIETDPAQ